MKADDLAKKPVPSKTEAEQVWLPKFITEVREGNDPTQPVAAPAGTMSVVSFIDEEYIPHHIMASNLSYEHALKSKMDVLKRRFGHLQLHALEKPGPIQDFQRELVQAGRAVATVNLYLAQLRHMVNWAIGRELLEKSPFHKYGIRLLKGSAKRNRRLHPDEEDRLVQATEALNNPRHWFQGQPMRDRIIVALDTGARRGEMQLIQNKHVEWKREPPLIYIPQENAKGGKERFIPVGTSRLLEVLQRRRFLGPDAFVLGDRDGVYVENFRSAWEAVLSAADIRDPKRGLDEDLHWHDLRHECGSRLAERGVPIHEIQYLLGHASIVTTQRYLNATLESLAKSMRVLDANVG